MPGSLASPVVLDPWQAIIEVGWGGEYLAFALNIHRRHPTSDTLPFSEMTGPICSDSEPIDTHLYTQSVESYRYVWDAPEAPIAAGAVVWRGSSWASVAITEVTGLPELETTAGPVIYTRSFGDIAIIAGATPDLSWWPRGSWAEPASSPHESDVPVPGEPDERFDVTSAATFRMLGDAPDGQACLMIGAERTVYISDLPPAHADVFDPLEISFAGITVTTAGGRTYRPVAGKVIPNTDEHPTTAGVFWVLCESVDESTEG